MVNLAGVGNTALNILVMIFSIIILGAIIYAGIYFYMRWKRYKEFKCVIWERDGFGQLCETYDQAGIFVDNKTKNKRLFLKKCNVGLQPDNIPYLPSISGTKIVYLLRDGLKNFRFIKPTIGNPNINLNVTEEDLNWGINAYERGKKLFSEKSFLQYLPYIAIAFVSIIILTIFIYFFKDFAVLKEVAIALKEAANAMAQAKAGTVIMQ